uniref:TATA box binding protein associated factor (TAF) histone-like fold domain-containing protein n=1 Tax=Lynx canadensis TaxID=61383 RepID=A0A667HYK7_LYNCA
MSEREERRFVEIPRESVRLMAESTGLELSDEVAALLAEDVCYRLREATQNSSQFMKHTKRRKLTVEDFNRALRWSSVEAVCGYGSQEALPLRPAREGELYFPEDREVNLVELALATNIPKGCAETAVRGDCRGPPRGGDRNWAVRGGVGGQNSCMRWCYEGQNPLS